MTTKPVVKSVNIFEWIGERMIRNLEEQPITVEIQAADGTMTLEVPPKHPWYKELSRRRAEQVKRLRASLKTSMGANEFQTDLLGTPGR